MHYAYYTVDTRDALQHQPRQSCTVAVNESTYSSLCAITVRWCTGCENCCIVCCDGFARAKLQQWETTRDVCMLIHNPGFAVYSYTYAHTWVMQSWNTNDDFRNVLVWLAKYPDLRSYVRLLPHTLWLLTSPPLDCFDHNVLSTSMTVTLTPGPG